MISAHIRRNGTRFTPRLEALEDRRLMAFLPAASYSANPSSHHIVAGEFRTGTGLTDLAVTNWSEDQVTVLPSKPNGTFGLPMVYNAGDNPTGIATGDLNCDGNLDLVATNFGVDSISILFGTGGRRFFPVALNYYAGNNAFEVAIADFTNDGMPDILTGHYTTSLGTDTLRLLKGHCSTNFDAASPINTNHTEVYDFEVGDFNQDGALDVAVTHHHLGGPVGILLGNGNGTFKPPVEYTVKNYPEGIASGDMNQDGKQDLLVAFTDFDEVGVLLGNGDGTFQAPVYLQMPGNWPAEIVVADFGNYDSGTGNPDGRDDFAVALRGSNEVAVCYNSGMFPLFSCITHGVGGDPYYDLVAANFDISEDTLLSDLATPNHGSPTVSVLINTSTDEIPPSDGFGLDPASIAAKRATNVGLKFDVARRRVKGHLRSESFDFSSRARPKGGLSEVILLHRRSTSESNDLLIRESSPLGDLAITAGLGLT